MKTREEIRESTKGKIPRPENYRYGTKLPEWELAETTLSRDDFLRRAQPMNDRIIVQLLKESQPQSRIILTDPKSIICADSRKAKVLKVGPGRWMPGEWWKVSPRLSTGIERGNADLLKTWEWFPGYRRPVSVNPGQIVLIGNWVDLELEDIALCAEGDIRSIWQN